MPEEDPTGTPQPADEDRLWTELVAAFHAADDPAGRPWPAAEDLPPPTTGSDRPDADPVPPSPVTPAGPARGPAPSTPVVPDDSFVPAAPPPLPAGDPVTRLAWTGVLGGPLFLLAILLLGRAISPVAGLGAVAAFLAGFVTLVWRMRDEPPDGSDDGAIV